MGTCPHHCSPSCSKPLRAVILLTVERERQLTSFPKFLILSHSIKNRQTCIHCLAASINTSDVPKHPHDGGRLGNELFPQQLQATALLHASFSPSAGRKVEGSRSEAKAENPRNSNAPQRETAQSLAQERGMLLLRCSALWLSKSPPWTSSSSPSSAAGPGRFSGPRLLALLLLSLHHFQQLPDHLQPGALLATELFLSWASSLCCSTKDVEVWSCVLGPNVQVQGLIQSRPALQLGQRPRLLAPGSPDFPASSDVPAFTAAPPVLTRAGCWMVSRIS